MVELKVRMSTKGQIVIPKIFREGNKMFPQEEFIIKIEQGKIIIEKQEGDIVEKLKEFARQSAKLRKGKKFVYNKEEFYEQYDERTRRSGIRV